MKRFFCILLTAALVLSISSCGGSSAGTEDIEKSYYTGSSAPVSEDDSNAAAPDNSGETEVPPSESDEDAFCFTRDNFPVIDGSTSMVPLGQGIASVLLGETREGVSDLISFNKTTQSFRNLAEGSCDIVIAAEPKSDVFDEMDEAGFEYEIETIAAEGLVFVVNEDNPVNSLTSQQIVDIYSGKITNWSEVGGLDEPIEAFQRNAGAGSQVMMEKLVMGDTPMAEAPEAYVVGEMGELIESVKNYDNSANAIGYTVYYYASDMQMAQGLKILSVDGIAPNAESLRDGSYPYINGYYSCIPAGLAEDDPARVLYDWLVSEAGQELLNMEGYVSVSDVGEAAETGSNVYVDYSGYTPYGAPEALYTRISDASPLELTVSDSYEMILPYCGSALYSDSYAGYDWQSGSYYGFFDINGELLTDPIYSSIYLTGYDTDTDSEPFWVVEQTPEDGSSNERDGFVLLDGSFASPVIYNYVESLGDYILCVTYTDDSDYASFDLYDHSGDIVLTQDMLQIDGHPALLADYGEGVYTAYAYVEDPDSDYLTTEYYYLDADFQVLSGPWYYASPFQDGTAYASTEENEYSEYLLDSTFTPISINGETAMSSIWYIGEGFLEITTFDGEALITDTAGQILFSSYGYVSADITDSALYIETDDQFLVYDLNGELLYTADTDGEWYSAYTDAIYYENTDTGISLRNIETGAEIDVDNGWYAYCYNDASGIIAVACETDDDDYTEIFFDRDLNSVDPSTVSDYYELTDPLTGETFLYLSNSYGFNGETSVFTADGSEELFRLDGSVGLYDGYRIATGTWASCCYDENGTLIFCYPFFGSINGD